MYVALSSHMEMCLFRSWAKLYLCQVWRLLGLLLHLGHSLLLKEAVAGWKHCIWGAEKMELAHKMPPKGGCC